MFRAISRALSCMLRGTRDIGVFGLQRGLRAQAVFRRAIFRRRLTVAFQRFGQQAPYTPSGKWNKWPGPPIFVRGLRHLIDVRIRNCGQREIVQRGLDCHSQLQHSVEFSSAPSDPWRGGYIKAVHAGALSRRREVFGRLGARPSISDFSSFRRFSMNWRSSSESSVLSKRRYRLMLLRCVRRRADFSSIIFVNPLMTALRYSLNKGEPPHYNLEWGARLSRKSDLERDFRSRRIGCLSAQQ